MGRWRRTTACERATQWVSLELDCELSEIERSALARHLDRCGRCASAAALTGTFTRLIREAPLVSPSAPVAVAMPLSERARIVRRAAATLALASLLGAAGGLLTLDRGSPGRASSELALANAKERLVFVAAKTREAELHPLTPDVLVATSPFALRVLQ